MSNSSGGSVNAGFKCTPGNEVPPPPPELAGIFKRYQSPIPAPVFPTWEIALKVLFYILAMLVDVIGNSLVIFIVSARRKMRTPTNVLLLNLAVADLLVALLCMWVHLGASITPDWPFGLGICKANMFAQVTAITTSILTLTVISVERFMAIVFPLRRGWTLRFTLPLLGIVWVIAASIAWPQLHVRYLDEREWADRHYIKCEENWTKVYKNEQCERWQPSRVIYHMFVVVVMFFVPIVVMIVSYTVICISLITRKAPGGGTRSDNQQRSKKRVIRMLMVLLTVFIVCWSPVHIIELHELLQNDQVKPPYMETVRYVVLYVAYLNSALNPVLYAGLNENMRRGFQDVFRCGCVLSGKDRRVFPTSRQSGPTQSRMGDRNSIDSVNGNYNPNQLTVPSRERGHENGQSRTQDTQFLQVHSISGANSVTVASSSKQEQNEKL